MARRRRAVERATSRQVLTDRIVVGVLIVVAASGLMSVLPAYGQVALSRVACQVVSLGLGGCGAPGIELENAQLSPARCSTLADLDAVLPEVRVEHVVTAKGMPVTISQARSGDVVVDLGPEDRSAMPDLLAGETRSQRTLLDGVSVPARAEWLLPRGQGLDQLVTATYDGHQQWVERRSALALIGSSVLGTAQQIPQPTVLFSRVRLDGQRLPRLIDQPGGPTTATDRPEPRGPRAPSDELVLDATVPAVVMVNTITGEAATSATVRGTVGGTPVSGSLRLTRSSDGAITGILLAVVSDGRLVPGEPNVSLSGPGVAYIAVPVRTESERQLVSDWVTDRDGLRIPLDELLGLREPGTDDRLAAFLTRAATVTVLRYGAVSTGDVTSRVGSELVNLRRQDWVGVRMMAAGTVAPQPSGGKRTLVDDPSCRT